MPKKVFLVFVFTALGICLWLSLIFLAPYLESASSPLSRWIYLMFAPTCHQNASRCFHLWGNPMAVCARCLGIYFGFLGGTFFYPVIRGVRSLTLPRLRVFFWISIPIAADALGNILSLWSSPAWLRLFLGIIWGSILPFYFIPGIADALSKSKKP